MFCHRFSWLKDLVARGILGTCGTHASRKVHAGFFGALEFSKG